MEDDMIISLYWRRDEQAIVHTADKYGSYCNTIAYHILGCREDADESVNDTYLRAWDSIPPTRPRYLGAFLGRIVRNLALDRVKRDNAKKRGSGEYEKALEELEHCLGGGEDPEQTLINLELKECITGFLRTLPEEQRRIFVRRYWHLYSAREIAEQFGCGAPRVRSMLHRTRAQLRRYLEERGML